MGALRFDITFPDDKHDEILDYFVRNCGWTDQIQDEDGRSSPNPETQEVAAKRFVLEFIKNHYRIYRVNVETAQARSTATQAAYAVDIR